MEGTSWTLNSQKQGDDAYEGAKYNRVHRSLLI